MRIMITGVSGFIGAHLLRRLVGEHTIFALVRRLPLTPHPGVQYIEQDVGKPLDRARLPAHVDAIIHQAALIQTESASDEAEPFLVNVVGTWRLLEYAATAGVHTFVHASTGGIYGCGDRPFVESDPPNPMDLYSLTKAQAELAVQAASGSFHKIILRYFFPYGVGTPNPIPRFVQRALTGEPIELLASGKPKFNPLHVSDAVEATARALHLSQSAILNIAGVEITTFGAIVELAAAQAGRTPQFKLIPDAEAIPYYRSNLVADITQMQKLLSFTPQVPLAAGIGQLVSSCKG